MLKNILKLTISICAFFVFAQGVSAATCNDQADGNWDNTATWDCGIVPDADDDVTIDSHTVTMTADSLSNTVTINGGTLNMGSYTHTNDAGWTYTSGTVDAGSSTLKFTGYSAITFVPGSVSYYNIEFAGSGGSGDITISGTVVVTNDLIISQTDPNGEIFSGTIEVQGDVDITTANYTGTNSTANIKLNGTGNQTISSTGGGSYLNIEIDKSSGIVYLSGIVPVSGNWTWTNGTFGTGTSTLKFTGTTLMTFTPGAASYYNIEFAGYGGGGDITISGTVVVTNDLVISQTDNNAELFSGTIEVHGDVDITTANYTGNNSTASIKLNGIGSQTISSTGGGSYPNMEIDKSSGIAYLSGIVPVIGNWTWTEGILGAGTSTLQFISSVDPQIFTPGDIPYYNIELAKSVSDDNVDLAGNLKVSNNLTITQGELDTSTSNYTITTKNFIQSNGIADMNSAVMKVTGNFIRTGGTFTYDTSIVAFQGKNQTITSTVATTTFYKLYKLVAEDDTLYFASSSKINIASGGNFTAKGLDERATLSLRSNDDGYPYYFSNSGSIVSNKVDIKDAYFYSASTFANATSTSGNTGLSVTKEFISTIRSSGGDYTTLSAWETAVQCDLTATSTLVFAHSGITGTIPDNTTVTGVSSGAVGTAVHVTGNQILIKNIGATLFQSGEQVQVDGSNYVTIADAGFGAIAVAHPYNDWASGLQDGSIRITGWTTDSTRYVKVYVPIYERHNGTVFDSSGDYTGFAIVNDTNAETLLFYEVYTWIEGLIINQNNKGGETYHGINMEGNYSSVNSVIVLNSPNNGFYINVSSIGYPSYLFNSVAYDNGEGLRSVYIPTIHGITSVENSNYGIYKNNTNTSKLANFLSSNNAVKDYYLTDGTFSVSNLVSSDDTADDFGGTGNRINQTPTYVDEANDDFHLAVTDTAAKDYGADLSVDTAYPHLTDIDGDIRGFDGAWDVGADEAPTQIFRSVGPSNTSALETGASSGATLDIINGTAYFSDDMPDNVGVGDVIQYDYDADGTLDTVAFIHGRTSNREYTVRTSLGQIATSTLGYDTDWSIYRAYTSLAAAETGTENSGLNDSLQYFENWSGGKDLVANNEQWNIALYAGSADTAVSSIGGWTTDAQHYLKIFAPSEQDEVGVTQRHSGVWDDTKARRVVSSGNGFNIWDQDVRIEGIQIQVNHDTSGYAGISLHETYIEDGAEFYFSDNIIKSSSSYVNDESGINLNYDGSYEVNIFNNIIYDFSYAGVNISSASTTVNIYNNSIFNIQDYGIYQVNTDENVTAVNNLIIGSVTDDYNKTFNSSSGYNISTDGTAPGSDSKTNVSADMIDFLDYDNDDFRLGYDDLIAKNAGTSSVATLSSWSGSDRISVDIAGNERNMDGLGYDIGASEVPMDFVSKIRTFDNADADFNKLSTWEDAIDSDLTSVNSRVFKISNTYDYASSTDDGTTITFPGGATGTLMHINSDDFAYVTNITGVPQTGTTTASSTNTFVVESVPGSQVGRAIAECYNDWPSGLQDNLNIAEWTTGENNYVKVYTPSSERHTGVAKNGSDFTGFTLAHGAFVDGIITATNYTVIDGLVVFANSVSSYEGIKLTEGSNGIMISNNIIFRESGGSGKYGISYYAKNGMSYIYNNIIYGTWTWGIRASYATLYNNIVYGLSLGILKPYSYSVRAINNISVNNTTADYQSDSGNFTADSGNNISSDGTADDYGGMDNITDVSLIDLRFFNTTSGSEDFHIGKDSIAVGAGTSSPSSIFTNDIDGDARIASSTLIGQKDEALAWDIGADQTAQYFVSRIRTGDNADSDYTTLSGWESANDVDLTSTGTLSFYYNPTTTSGTIPDDYPVIGALSGAIGTTTHVTATSATHQILIKEITGEFVSGEKVYIRGGSSDDNYVYLTTKGSRAIAVAEAYNDWSGDGLSDTLRIGGWNTDKGHYIKFYTPLSERHNGTPLSGFRMRPGGFNSCMVITSTGVNDYSVLDGIECLFDHRSNFFYAGYGKNHLVRNNLAHSVDEDMYAAQGIYVFYEDSVFYNNVIYDVSGFGIICGWYDCRAFNNTIYNSGTGIGTAKNFDDMEFKNNIVVGNDVDFDIAYLKSTMDYNISSDSTAPGDNSLTNVDYTQLFADADNGDFRLMPESVAVDAGTSSPFSSITALQYDIAGTGRPTNLSFDIGAFEAPQILYRSVGLQANDLNTNDAKITLSDNIATFDDVLPNNIGVGDVLQIGTTSPYTLGFIHGRISSTTYYAFDKDGNELTATTGAPVAIYRAHEHLDDWEDQLEGDVNQSIDSSLRADVLVDMDLVTTKTAMFVPAYASTTADNLAAEINGWTTGTSTYIKVYAPESEMEVGISQRHVGIWDDSKYRIEVLDANPFSVKDDYITVMGLQVHAINAGNGLDVRGYDNANNKITISSNIIKSSISAVGYNQGVYVNGYVNIYIVNNVIYGFKGDNQKYGIYVSNAANNYLYNNTISDNYYGIKTNLSVVKNNAVFNNIDDFTGTLVLSEYNASDDGNGNNAISLASSTDVWIATFMDYENYDFRIKDIASPLYDAGTTITIVTDDIAGNSRPYDDAYDIGAFEFTDGRPKFRFSPGGSFKMQGSFKFK